MIVDHTGTVLTPGNMGRDCLGNGEHLEIECCCDACDYLICCQESHSVGDCLTCSEKDCPRRIGCSE